MNLACRLLLTSAFALGVFAGPAACSGGVVGGECKHGYAECGRRCISVTDDVENCGACGTVCSPGQSCVEGACTSGDGGGEGGATDSGAGGEPGDSSIGAGGGGGEGGDAGASGGSPDGGDGGFGGGKGGGGGAGGAGGAGGGNVGGSGNRDGGPECLPPHDVASHCGDCDTRCASPSPLCELGESGYECVAFCTPPLVQCGESCVNTDTDENHCGDCTTECPSGICQGGECRGATAGHISLLCMDYRRPTPAGSSAETLLGNSVLLARQATVRILAYDQYTRGNAVVIVDQTITAAATVRGRPRPAITHVGTSLEVTNGLDVTNYDVLLVYDQPDAPAGRLAQVGASWADAIDSFTKAGGAVAVLAGLTGVNEMDELLTSANLLPVTSQPTVTGQTVYVRAPGDAIGIGVLTPFRAPQDTCTFATSATSSDETVFVVTDTEPGSGLGAPVVVHRVILP